MNDICGRDWVYGGGDHGDPGNSIPPVSTVDKLVTSLLKLLIS